MSRMMFVIMLVLTFALSACIKAKPYDYVDEEQEGVQGPGLFTGKSGEMTLYRSRTRRRR